MKVCVIGLWHLGTVTAACLASAGHKVIGLDYEMPLIQQLEAGKPPIYEPGLKDLVKRGLAERNLLFTTDPKEAFDDIEVVWVTYDTPVDENDHADIDFVVDRIRQLFPHLTAGMLVLISSQVPVGTTRCLEREYAGTYPGKTVSFAYLPENLRLGKAIDAFTKPDRIVAGVRNSDNQKTISQLFRPYTENIEWMSVESAEMTKHALNSFLATSVAFANEVAVLCEQVGADATEVEQGLKSDNRIGPKAYLSPGEAFSGGTLARDVMFLECLGRSTNCPTHLISAVRTSNNEHKNWVRHKLRSLLGNLCDLRVTVWGLTYKPGTDTLRRSGSVELCEWLDQQGAMVRAHDPAIKVLPEHLSGKFELAFDPILALKDASALVVGTAWPDYRSLDADAVVSHMMKPIVIDPKRFLAKTLGDDPRIQYITIGKQKRI